MMIFEFLPSNEMSTAEVHQMSTVEVHQLMMLNVEAQALSEMSTPEHHQLTLSIVEMSEVHQLSSILEVPRVEAEQKRCRFCFAWPVYGSSSAIPCNTSYPSVHFVQLDCIVVALDRCPQES